MEEITFDFATSQHVDFIYHSLCQMVKEENIEERFFLTANSLSQALFSELAFAQVLLAFLDQQPVALIMFSETKRNFDLFNAPVFIFTISTSYLLRAEKKLHHNLLSKSKK